MQHNPTEKSVQASILAHARKLGILARKVETPGHAGTPDLLLMFEGRVLWLEARTDVLYAATGDAGRRDGMVAVLQGGGWQC